MRHLVLSDLHSNLEALQAALGYARGLNYDGVLALGDIVGYGADPNAVVGILAGLPRLLAIRGNHDRVAAGLGVSDDFNEVARIAADWTREALDAASRAFLGALPKGPRPFGPGRLMAHGSPLDEDEYVLDEGTARRCFDHMEFDLCFFGHSHYPCCFTKEGERVSLQVARGDRIVFTLAPGRRYLINPGSLGQPRDRDPRCAFALYDEPASTVTIHRVDYPVERAREKILAAGLPAPLADRLRIGV